MKTSLLMIGILAFGCDGGGTGVPSDTAVADLTSEEIVDVCESLVDLLGPERTVDCDGEAVTIGGEDTAECIDDFEGVPDGCSITVGEEEACVRAIAGSSDDEICEGIPAECAPLFDESCSG